MLRLVERIQAGLQYQICIAATDVPFVSTACPFWALIPTLTVCMGLHLSLPLLRALALYLACATPPSPDPRLAT